MMKSTFAPLLFILFLISGCLAQPQSSEFLGVCKKTVKKVGIYSGREDQYRGNYILLTKANPNYKKDKLLGSLPVGQKLLVKEILKSEDWGWGGYLTVKAKLLGGPYAGIEADIPSCVPYHFTLSWFENCTTDPDALIFNESIVVDCDQE